MKLSQLKHFLLIVILILLSYTANGFFTYNDNYSEENYEYTDSEEEEIEEEANFLPVFLSSPTVYRVERGNSARLECRVERLGPMILSWKRLINNSSEYIATGNIVVVNDKRVSVLTSTTSSMLLITLMSSKDTGEYICEVSSTPPVHMKHWLKMKAPPGVSILGLPTTGQYTLQAGQELGLVCRGTGEPAPTLSWRREGQLLPDGQTSVSGDQLIYSSVGSHHAGTYTCTGSSGGREARESVLVHVEYVPLVEVDQAYIHHKHNISLELVCYVQSYPVASVEWSRKGEQKEINKDRSRVDLRGEGRHVLILDTPIQSDMGQYICTATNTMGTVQGSIHVYEPSPDITAIEVLATASTTESPDENDSDIDTVINEERENHKMLKHILHKMNKFERVNSDMVKAMKESNRYLYQIMKYQRRLLNSTNVEF